MALRRTPGCQALFFLDGFSPSETSVSSEDELYSAMGPLFNSSKCVLGFQRAGTLCPSSWYYTKNTLHFQKEKKKNRLLGMCKQVSYCKMCISRERKVVYLPYLSWYVFAGMCCLRACSQRGIWSRDVLCPVQPQVCWASRWNRRDGIVLVSSAP